MARRRQRKRVTQESDPALGLVLDGGTAMCNVGDVDIQSDWLACSKLLDCLGVSDGDGTLLARLKAEADHWLRSASSAGHPAGCQDKLCSAARKVNNFISLSS